MNIIKKWFYNKYIPVKWVKKQIRDNFEDYIIHIYADNKLYETYDYLGIACQRVYRDWYQKINTEVKINYVKHK